MKKLFFVLIVLSGLGYIMNAQSSSEIDSQKFYTAFSSVLEESDNNFKDIISDTKVHGSWGNEKIVIDFPGAEVAYYEYWYDDGQSCNSVVVQYYKGNDFEKASNYHIFLKTCLINMKDQNKFGTWVLNEDIHSDGTFYWIDMHSTSYPDLSVTLSCSLYEDNQNIELKFELIEGEYSGY